MNMFTSTMPLATLSTSDNCWSSSVEFCTTSHITAHNQCHALIKHTLAVDVSCQQL